MNKEQFVVMSCATGCTDFIKTSYRTSFSTFVVNDECVKYGYCPHEKQN